MFVVSSSTDTRHPPDPVRLVGAEVRNPFVPGREVAFARVEGDALRALDVRDGDHVVLARRDAAEHGDVAAVLDGEGRATLWKVYPDGDRLRLSLGLPGPWRTTPRDAKVHGVVVAVLRRLAP
jgi:SOS-response transcriptional repressor LexA